VTGRRNAPSRWVYRTQLWARLRLEQLRREPLCRYCAQMGETVPATVVDHVIAHRGDRALAFDPTNLQSLCAPCHDRHAQAKDRGLPVAGCDADGYPLDPEHAWSVGRSVGRQSGRDE